jgi:CDP-glucose 4,6-dehydratase
MDLAWIKTLQNQNGPILVTGHTGFKGSWLTLLLRHLGVEVIGYSLPPTKESLYEKLNISGSFPEEFADILDAPKLERFMELHNPSMVIHLAAQSLVPQSYEDPKSTFEVNVFGTINVLQAALKVPSIKSVLSITSDKVYLNTGANTPYVEASPLGGVDPYSASKAASEMAIAAWANLSESKNGPVVLSARSGNVIGGGDTSKDRLIPDIVRGLNENKTVAIRNPNFTRPWQHVLDTLIGYLILLMRSNDGLEHTKFNFGPKDPSLTVQQICDLVKGHWGERISFGLISQNDFHESSYLELNCDLASIELNWEPLMSQKEALINTLEWWDTVLSKPGSEQAACERDIHGFLNKLFIHTGN